MNQIVLSHEDFSNLYKMILTLLEKNDSSATALNRLNMAIKQARVVDMEKIKMDFVHMNSVVEVTFTETGKSRVFKLVYPDEISLGYYNISVLTPLGCALLGAEKGQMISVHSPEGFQEVTVKNILSEPEAGVEDMNY